jgi:hypothetical protein
VFSDDRKDAAHSADASRVWSKVVYDQAGHRLQAIDQRDAEVGNAWIGVRPSTPRKGIL